MKAWEIWSYQPAGWPEPHPAVIVSGAGRVAHKPELNIIMCSAQPAGRSPLPNEVILDKADGLNWPTLCKCDLLHLVDRADLKNRRGQVSPERRGAIIATMIRSNEWIA
jgi:hypothetical protein